MAEDDGNPFAEGKKQYDYYRAEGWRVGRQHERDNPSPSTIEKIEKKFAERVKEAIRKADAHSYKHISMEGILNIIDNLLKECEED